MIKYILLLTLLVIASCNSNTTQNPTDSATTEAIALTPEQIAQAGITIGTIPVVDMNTSLSCNGMLALPPQNLASVHAPVQGFVTPGKWLEGDLVKKGEVLATLQHQDIIKIQQDYLESLSKLNYLKLDYERKQKLAAGDATSSKQLQETESNYQVEKARVAGLAQQLKFVGLSPDAVAKGDITSTISIRAPFTGYVTAIKVNQGKLVMPNDLIYEMVDKTHMHVEISVFAAEAAQVKEGQQFVFTMPGDTQQVKGVVHLVGRKIDDLTKAVNIHGHLITEDVNLLPGNFVQVTLYTGIKKTHTLNRSALIEQGGKYYAYVSTPEGFEKVLAETGMTNDQQVEILKLGQYDLATTQVVLSGAYYINGSSEE